MLAACTLSEGEASLPCLGAEKPLAAVPRGGVEGRVQQGSLSPGKPFCWCPWGEVTMSVVESTSYRVRQT